MKFSTFLIVLATVSINLLVWVGINKPTHLVESNYPFNSLSFNPYKKSQSPFDNITLTPKQLEEDLKLLSTKTRTVRLYSATHGVEGVPPIAQKYGMKVVASAFLNWASEKESNDLEVASAIGMAKKNKNVTHVILGNETQLHKTLPRSDLLAYLREARKKLKTPVSTAETWDFWIDNPDMAEEVDFIAIHVLPYWLEIPIEEAVNYVLDKYQLIKSLFPSKKIMIAETGWPSDGPQRGAAKATVAHQAQFVREFIRRAEPLKINYNVIEAFDQPWKSAVEGRVGEHWGIMDADRGDKFPIKGPVLEDVNWKYWALSSTALGFLASLLFLFRRSHLKKRGQFFSVIVFQVSAALATQLAREASNEYMSPGDIVFWAVMITAQVLLAILLLTDAAEVADVVGNRPLRRCFILGEKKSNGFPFVSIHLAISREPPEMVLATLNSLSKLNYPNFEVIVVDNNTSDETLWKPVFAMCAELGEKFRFYSLGKCPGFKAGALNFALRIIDPRAEIIGVVDADYIVQPDWLKSCIPYFEEKEVALVQAPQEHRGWENNLFYQMENDEFCGFFRIGMVQRNEHNAIIQHGTMTLICKKTLDALNGWAEWCICEDAELGLRILNLGKKTVYLDHPFGRGLVPATYEAYAKQRFRWAYGAMKILKAHWRKVFGFQGGLSWAQRYHFFRGWLPWIGDALHLVFSITGIVWSVILFLDPEYTDFPEPIFLYPALLFVALRICGTLWTYASRVKIGSKRTLLALIAGGSLTHKIARAVFQGFLPSSQPFYRTAKMEGALPVLKALSSVREELFLMMALMVSSLGIFHVFGTVNSQAVLWATTLMVQTLPYQAAVTASLLSSFAGLNHQRESQELKVALGHS